MRSSLASRSDARALAAAMARHPAGGARRAAAPAPPVASFVTVAALLTGPWRVNDPVAFAAAMRAAPLVAGYPAVDLWACARQPTVQFDPLSAALAGHLERAVEAAPERSNLTIRWVAGRGGRYLFVETAARAPADAEGPELLVLAHLVEPGDDVPGLTNAPPLEDDSWVVVVVGDGHGGVAGIGRAALPRALAKEVQRRPAWASTATPGAAADASGTMRLALAALRERLVAPALAAEGLVGPADTGTEEAVVLPFRR